MRDLFITRLRTDLAQSYVVPIIRLYHRTFTVRSQEPRNLGLEKSQDLNEEFLTNLIYYISIYLIL